MGSSSSGDHRRPRLLEVVRERLRTRHYSRRTERACVGWIRRFIQFDSLRHPREMGEAEVVAFLSSLATHSHVAASTQNQVLSAIVFLYSQVLGLELDWLSGLVRARRPVRLPGVLTREEVQALLSELRGAVWLMASLMYGSGLRLLECAELRVKDIDLANGEIRVRDGKGRKDRVTMMRGRLREALERHLSSVRQLHERDIEGGGGWVALPDALSDIYPNAGREWRWQWVFPATRTYMEGRTRRRRRHHLHESVAQRDVKAAVGRAELTQAASCHTLRHSFATHLLESGYDIRTIQGLTGDFAEAVIAQDRCIEQGNAREGNRHAATYIAVAREILASGEAAIEVFCSLLHHSSASVRAMAAAYLLRSRTERAVAALRPIADGRGLAALGAQMTLERYERGDLEIT